MKRSVFLSTMGLFLAINLFGQPAREVISINSGKDLSTLRTALPVPEGAVQSRAFDWNPRLRQLTASNEGDTLLLEFFDNRQYKAVIHRVTTGYDGVLGITAKIVGFDFASCFITLSDAGISISADLPERDEQYRAAAKDRQTILTQYVLSAVRAKEPAPGAALPPPANPSDQTRSVQMRRDVDLEAPVTIDVLVVYNVKARQWAEQNHTNIDNAVSLAIQRANYVLDNSQTNITLNMVYKHETDYTGDYGSYLQAITEKGDGKMDEVHDLRRQYRADLVTFIVDSDYTGFGYGLTEDFLEHDYSHTGFSAVGIDGACNYYHMIHEMGHNMGGGHNWQQTVAPDPGIFSYSSGWRGLDGAGQWICTVMAYPYTNVYPDGNPSTQIPYFSNPDITVRGVRIGSVEKENNVLTLKRTKHTISRYSEMLDPQNPFEVSSSGVLTRYNGAGGNVSIPAYIGIKTIGASAFRGNVGLLSVIVPSGISAIEERAFENCTKLSKATLPATLARIGASAFGGCTNLNQIFVNSATPPDAASNVFSGINLSSCNLIVPSGKKGVYRAAPVWKDFGIITEGYAVSTDFVIENGVLIKYTGGDMEVRIPAEVVAIGDSVFFSNWSIFSVVINEGVTRIGKEAFYNCVNLQTVRLPNTVTSIGENAFTSTGLTSIDVGTKNPIYSSKDGVLFNKDQTTLLLFPREKFATTYTIPNTVQTIGKNAFIDSWGLPSIIIPNSVKTIEGGAFQSSRIKSVTVSASVTTIGWGAFEWCDNLESIEVDRMNPAYASRDGLLYDKEETTLIQCPGGKQGKVTIPGSVTLISAAFWGCSKLDSVIIPSSVKEFYPDPFGYCRNLRYVEVHWRTPLSVSNEMFSQAVDLPNATLAVPPGTKALYQAAPVWKNFGTIKEEAGLGTEEIDVAATVTLRDHTLYISSPTAEQIEVYSFSGARIFSATKDAGEASFTIPASEKAVIVHGSSGWTKKTIDN